MTFRSRARVRLLYTVASFENNEAYVYLRTTNKRKAYSLLKRLQESPVFQKKGLELDVIANELDQPVYLLDLETKEYGFQKDVVKLGEPDADADIIDDIIVRKERIC